MGMGGALHPSREGFILAQMLKKNGVDWTENFVVRIGEMLGNPRQLFFRERRRAILDVLPFSFDFFGKFLRRQCLYQNLDARFVQIIAAAIAVINAQRRFQITHHVLPRQIFFNHWADDRRAAQSAADQHIQHHFVIFIAAQKNADVVHHRRGAIFLRAAHGDLEFARQVSEFGMESRPLAQHFAIRPRIDNLVFRHTSEVIAGDIANAIATGLDRVHFHRREVGENIRRVFQLGPVVLDVLARSEMRIIFVVLARDVREHAKLF